MEFNHKSVLLREVIEGLAIKPEGTYVDGTLGGGGHSGAILEKLNDQGRLIGIDQDEAAVAAAGERLERFTNVTIVRDNYCNIRQILEKLNISEVDGILLDLGVSSYQLDTPERGFSYMSDAPLDMRMDKRSPVTAADIVNGYSQSELTSDYVDYIDTYRKNRDLSQEAKDRIKSAMAKHRNSYKEMFVADYATYIQYESSGALRHNKVVRAILFNYCPFSKVIREGAIATNPQYTQLIERYNHKAAHDIHLFEIATGRIEKGGHDVPKELLDHDAFLHL